WGGAPPPRPPTTPKYITIVGSRRCSEYAKQVTEEICKSLQGQNIVIVSGLAQGVDAHAHKFALKYNISTIAVLGCGLADTILRQHPNYKLSQKILEQGGMLISEYGPNKTSRPYMFPARNRIMVGISNLIIVIEAKEKSGTSITARLATDYNRDLMVIPNSIYSHYSKGSNELIKQGAYVYTKPEDIFNILKLEYKGEQKINSYTPTPLEKEILRAILNNIQTTQQIIEYTQHLSAVSEIIQALLNLEIEEVVKRVDGKYILI
ncbi:MAG: hypothetical protein RLY49_522, partial [Candidatus Parcubacteria bacterium]